MLQQRITKLERATKELTGGKCSKCYGGGPCVILYRIVVPEITGPGEYVIRTVMPVDKSSGKTRIAKDDLCCPRCGHAPISIVCASAFTSESEERTHYGWGSDVVLAVVEEEPYSLTEAIWRRMWGLPALDESENR